MTTNVREMTDEGLGERERSSEPLLVDFWAPWCGPCRMQAPVLEEMASRFEGRLSIGKINVDDHPEAAVRHGVRGIPTLILFAAGRERRRWTGFTPREELAAALETALVAEPKTAA